MPKLKAAYRGAVQAQGDDIKKKGGYTRSWAQEFPVTADEGLAFLSDIEGQCNKNQKNQRKFAFVKAKRFIENARKAGGVWPEAQPHSFQHRQRTVNNARVDIEIRDGITFIPFPISKSKE